MALKAGYKGFKTLGPGLDYDSVTGHLFLNGESDISLDNLKDVSIDTPVDGDILIYDSTTETWYNEQIDSDPTEDSSKPVSSGGVYAALADKADNSVIAPVENGTTASQTYETGSLFIRNGAFCTVIQATASGATWILNTNYIEGTISELINKRLNVFCVNSPANKTAHTLYIPSSRKLLIMSGASGVNRAFAAFVYTNSSGVVDILDIAKGNDVTLAAAGANTLTITYDASSYVYLKIIDMGNRNMVRDDYTLS